MFIYNGLLTEGEQILSIQNRGLKFGDSVFETFSVIEHKIIFFEDHYFRFIAAMRIMRMEIPMSFTPDFFQAQILELLSQRQLQNARIRLTIFRREGGLYRPDTNKVDFIIEATELLRTKYKLQTENYQVDLYKDFKKNKGLLATIKSNNKLEHILAGIYAQENGLQNALLLNSDNRLAEAINANIFIVQGNKIITPLPEEGCVKGIVRKKIIEFLTKSTTYEIIETELNHFEMMRADEAFLTNISFGIQPITQFRKKKYTQFSVAEMLLGMLNESM